MEKNKRNIAILLMAGSSTRIRADINVKKQFYKVNGRELFLLSLDTFIKSKLFSDYVLVISDEDKEQVEDIVRRERLKVKVRIVTGGKDRNESVLNALLSLRHVKGDFKVYIHDAARPYVSLQNLYDLDSKSSDYDALTLACPVYDSLLRDDGKTTEYIDRSNVYQVQTPQVFSYRKLVNLFIEGYDPNSTDDYSKAVFANFAHFVIKSTRNNYKITILDDLNLM